MGANDSKLLNFGLVLDKCLRDQINIMPAGALLARQQSTSGYDVDLIYDFSPKGVWYALLPRWLLKVTARV